MTDPDLDEPASALLAALRRRQADMVDLLERLVALESPSRDGSGQDAVGRVVAAELAALGLAVERLPSAEFGDHLLARRPQGTGPTQLLVGHMDTVWPVGTTAQRPATVEDGRLLGPGSFDMKAGLVQMIHALRSVEELDLALPADPVVFVNTDEEVGSPDSRTHLEPLARDASRAFVLEGSFGPAGQLKVGRKGVGRYRIKVKGVSAHAGLDPGAGSSAVLEMSLQIQRLFELNDLERGITVNVGTVDGGLRPNVVAPEATAEIDVRVLTAADAIEIDRALHELEPVGDGVAVEVEGSFDRPPMEANEANMALWDQARQAGEALGLDLEHAVVGGASDGNLTSVHTPTLDGLGAVGDGAHRPDEHVVVDAMVERTALLALLLAAPLPASSTPEARP